MRYFDFSKDGFKDEICLFKCSGKCLETKKICDGVSDCQKGEDEKGCGIFVIIVEKGHCRAPFDLKCNNENKCYQKTQICDGFLDCANGLDESNCIEVENKISKQNNDSLLKFYCENGRAIPLYKHCDGIKECLNNEDESSCGIYFLYCYLALRFCLFVDI